MKITILLLVSKICAVTKINKRPQKQLIVHLSRKFMKKTLMTQLSVMNHPPILIIK